MKLKLYCLKRIFKQKSIIINLIDEFIFLLEKYLINEFIISKENTEIILYFKYTEIINLSYENNTDNLNYKKLLYTVNCVLIERKILKFINNPFIKDIYFYNINKIDIKKFTKDIINDIFINSEYLTRNEFFNIIQRYKDNFKIRNRFETNKLLMKKSLKRKKKDIIRLKNIKNRLSRYL